MSKIRIYDHYKHFQDDRNFIEDYEVPRFYITSITENKVKKVKQMIIDDQGIAIREIISSMWYFEHEPILLNSEQKLHLLRSCWMRSIQQRIRTAETCHNRWWNRKLGIWRRNVNLIVLVEALWVANTSWVLGRICDETIHSTRYYLFVIFDFCYPTWRES